MARGTVEDARARPLDGTSSAAGMATSARRKKPRARTVMVYLVLIPQKGG